jgi:hypothetical protein
LFRFYAIHDTTVRRFLVELVLRSAEEVAYFDERTVIDLVATEVLIQQGRDFLEAHPAGCGSPENATSTCCGGVLKAVTTVVTISNIGCYN